MISVQVLPRVLNSYLSPVPTLVNRYPDLLPNVFWRILKLLAFSYGGSIRARRRRNPGKILGNGEARESIRDRTRVGCSHAPAQLANRALLGPPVLGTWKQRNASRCSVESQNHTSCALAPWYDGQIAAAQDLSSVNWQHTVELPVASLLSTGNAEASCRAEERSRQ